MTDGRRPRRAFALPPRISIRAGLVVGAVVVAGIVAACAEFVVGPTTPVRSVRAIQLSSTAVTLDDGQTSSLVATLLDQDGVAFQSLPAGVTVDWSSSAPDTATVDATGVVTGQHPGGATVTASVEVPGSGIVSVAAQVKVNAVPTALAVVSGDKQSGEVGLPLPAPATVRVLDRHGDGVANVAMTVTVTAGSGAVDAGNGAGTSFVTDSSGVAPVRWTLGTTAGRNAIEVGTARLPGAVVAFTATGTPGPVSAVAKATGDAQTGNAGQPLPSPLVARVTDRYGNGISGMTVTWSVATGGGSVTPPSDTTDSTGAAATQFTLGAVAGQQTVRATVGGVLTAIFVATATAPVARVDVAPTPATLASGTTRQLTATAYDASNQPIAGTLPVAWTSLDPTIASVASDGTVTGILAGSTTIRATIFGVVGEATVTVTPGAASAAKSTVSVSSGTVASGSTITLTLQARDAAGNAIATGGLTVVFTASGGGSTGAISATTDNGNGSYTATFTAQTAGAATTIGATVNGVAVSTALPTITVRPGAPSVATSTVTVSGTTIAVGQSATLALRVRDAAGNALTTGGLAVQFTATGGTSVGTIGPVTDNGDGSYTALFTATAAGTPLTIGATIGGVAVTSTLPTIRVQSSTGGQPVLHWIGASGNWSDPTHWDAGRVPTTSDTVRIDAAGSYVVTLDQPATITTLVLGPGAAGAVALAAQQPLSVTDSIQVAVGGILQLVAAVNVTAPKIVNAGLISFTANGTVAGPVTSSGAISALAGVGTFKVDPGQTVTSTGTISVSAGATLAVAGGSLVSSGTVGGAGTIDVSAGDGPMQWWGMLAPTGAGGAFATLQVNGGFVSPDAGPAQVLLRLGGTAGASYDHFVVAGAADLSAAVATVTLANGFTPAPGDSFTVASYGPGSRAFATVNPPPLPAGLGWITRNANSSLTLVVYQPGVPTRMTFNTQPSTTTAGSAITPAVQVMLVDAQNVTATAATGVVTVAILDSAGTATGQSAQASPVNGIATFPSLAITKAGSYSLRASWGTLPTVTSSSFAVVAGTATGVAKDAGDAQSGTVGQPLAQPIRVKLTDASGNPVPNVAVAFVVTSGGGSVTPTSPTTDANGLAATSWTLGGVAGTQTVEARVTGLTAATFSATATAGSPAKLAFTVQPSSGTAGQTIAPAIQVSVQDALGNRVTSSTAPVTIAIGTNPSGALLSGTKTVAAVSGIATFSDLSLDKGGIGYTLVAASSPLASATSAAFDVSTPATVVLDMGGNPVVGIAASATVTARLTTPAPSGGIVVTLTSDDPSRVSVRAPGTVFIAQGATSGDVTIDGIALGSTTLHGTATGYAEGTLVVQATNQIISTPTTLNVPFGLTTSLPVTLAVPAPAGGLTVTLTTSDPTHVGVVTQTVSFAGGSQSANGTLSGVAPGSATITASAIGWVRHTTLATTTADLGIVPTSVSLDPVFPKSITVQFMSGGVARAAPAGGIPVTITPTNAACAVAQSPLTIPAGQTSVTSVVSYGGSATLPCTTVLTATSPNLTQATTTANVNPPPAISLGTIGQVGSGLELQRSVSLGAVAPASGAIVHISSADPTRVLLAPNALALGDSAIDVTIPPGQASGVYVVQGLEGVTGSVQITATSPPYVAAASTATVVTPAYQLSSIASSYTTLDAIAPFYVSVGLGGPTGLTSVQQARGAGPGFTVTLTSSNPAAGNLATRADTGSPETVVIAPGQSNSPTSIANGGVGFHPLATGTTTIAASIPGLTPTQFATKSVTVTQPALSFQLNPQVGSGLQMLGGVNLGAPAPTGGVTVHVVSTDSSRIVLSPNATTAGIGSVDVTIPAGQTSGLFEVQGLDGVTGAVVLDATAPQFAPKTATVTVTTPVYQLSSLGTTYTSLDPIAQFYVMVGTGTVSGLSSQEQVRAGSAGLTVTLTSSDPAVGDLVTKPDTGSPVTLVIPAGQAQTPTSIASGGVGFRPKTSGTTTIAASIPGLLATTFATKSITVSQPGVFLLNSVQLGSGLQVTRSFSLGAPAPAGGLTVHIVSADPSIVLLAPDAGTPGTGSLDVAVGAGQTSGTFVVQAPEGVTGDVTLTASAPLYADGSGVMSVVQPVVQLGGLQTTISTIAQTAPFYVQVGVGGQTGLTSVEAARVGGPGLTATVANSRQSIGQLVTLSTTGQSATVAIAPGQSNSPTTISAGGVGFDPLAADTTTVSVVIPGFLSTNFATRTVTVTAPTIILPTSTDLGTGLQQTRSASLSAVSTTSGVTVHLTSSDPNVLLAANASSAGAQTLDVVLPANTPSFTYVVQALENFTGTVTITATAPGYVDGSTPVNVVTPVFSLTAGGTVSLANGPIPIYVMVGVGNVTGLTSIEAVRFGSPGLTATITNSNASVGDLLESATSGQTVTVPIPPGSSNSPTTVAAGGAAFRPLTTGTTTVTASIPGLTATTTATRTYTVNP